LTVQTCKSPRSTAKETLRMTSARSWSVPLIFVYLFSTLLIAGCGKPALDTIKVEPAAATLPVGQPLQLRATGLDAKGQPIEGLNFTWSVVEDSGRIDATGLFTALTPGTTTVTVASGTVQSTATLTVEREKAAKIVAVVEPPEVTAGQQVQLTVTVQNAEGRGIASVPVQAQPTSQDTAIDPPTATTDANGQATFAMTAARQATANQVQLSADGQQTMVAVQGQAGLPATVRVTTAAREVVAGEEAGLQVVVQDEAGNPIPNQQVSFTPLSDGTIITPAQPPTDARAKPAPWSAPAPVWALTVYALRLPSCRPRKSRSAAPPAPLLRSPFRLTVQKRLPVGQSPSPSRCVTSMATRWPTSPCN